ncbi:MAG: hypothetical protein COA78_33280 [Blastopirellula sp.]|nr:MAG: hypothetical protein COA78_33280 [Blastopirellula sp.]
MAIEHLSATLQVWRYTGGKPKPAEFLDQLVVDTNDNVKKRKTPSPRVDVMFIERSEFTSDEEPSESFAAELETRLTEAAGWLNKQPTSLFKSLRKSGFNTRLLFTGWIDCDQMDLDLPPALLKACGKHGLKISIITND